MQSSNPSGGQQSPSRLENPVKRRVPKKRKLKNLSLSEYAVKPPSSGKAFEIETGPDSFKLHTLLIAIAKRGGGSEYRMPVRLYAKHMKHL